MNTIHFDYLKEILWNLEGKEILISTGVIGFTFRSLSKLEKVDMYTDEIKLTLENLAEFELCNDIIENIVHENELSRNNTKTIRIKLNNEQLIKIEYLAI